MFNLYHNQDWRVMQPITRHVWYDRAGDCFVFLDDQGRVYGPYYTERQARDGHLQFCDDDTCN